MKLEIAQDPYAWIAGLVIFIIAVLGLTVGAYFQSAILFIITVGIIFFPKEQKKDEVKSLAEKR